jgi:ferredoxin
VPGLLELAIVFAFGWFAMGWWPCGACVATCHTCPDNKASPTYKIVIDGFTNGVCVNCGDYNGTYFVPFTSETHNQYGASCYWHLEAGLPNTCVPDGVGPNYLRLTYQQPGIGTLVDLNWSGAQFAYWQNYTSSPDCDALTDHDVAFLSTKATCAGTPTCKVTSQP